MSNYRCFTALLILAMFISAPIQAQGLSADDFLPPVGAPSPEERQTRLGIQGSVTQVDDTALGGTVVQADQAQDAINYIVQQRSPGAYSMRVGSGIGWVATGQAFYNDMPNPTATRIARREAYVRAFLEAKRYLAETLTGLSVEGQTTVAEQIETVTDAQRDLNRFASTQAEKLEQSVQMLLRGFVVYSVEDDAANNTVYVSIVTTPKTRGQFNRPSLNGLESASLQDGLNQVLTEIQSGIVPPVGGRIIQVPETGEMGFVGFGSDVLRFSDNPALQARNRVNAERIAQMRAADALVGLIIGDDSRWKGQLEERTRRTLEEFERSELEGENSSLQRFEQARESFVNTQISSDELQSVRRGTLPPGVMRRSFTTEDGAEVYSLAVYIPSMSQAASQAAQDMQSSPLVAPPGDGQTAPPPPAVPSQPATPIAPGPSGQISDDQNL